MSVSWTLVGEAGKALDATSRTLEQLAIDSANLTFNSLDSDELTLSISPQSLSSTIIPDLKQKVTLYRDSGSGPVRFFTGHVTNVRSIIDSNSEVCNITISGPWWWMERINFTSELPTAVAGVTAERMTAVFGNNFTGADLRTSLLTAINRSAALGTPIYAPVAPYPDAPGKFYVLGVVHCVRVQSDGKVVCAGTISAANQTAVSKMVRFNTDGSVDTSFTSSITSDIRTFEIDSSGNFHVGLLANGYRKISSTGTAINSATTNNQIESLKIQSDGKIIIGGQFTTVTGVAKVAVARLNANATLDTTFTGPTFTTATTKRVRAVELSSTGKIYIGGDFYVTATQRNILRLLSTGAIDTSFQTKNVTTNIGLANFNLPGSTTYGQVPFVNKIQIQNDGKIVICGGFVAIKGAIHGIARFSDTGVLDSLFGSSVPDTYTSFSILENTSNPTSRLFYVTTSSATVTIGRLTNLGVFDKFKITRQGGQDLVTSSQGVIYCGGTGTSTSSGLIESFNDSEIIYPPDYELTGIAPFFQLPRITLNQSTCAEVISELVRLCPDSMVYFDYSDALPKCVITRRGVCGVTTINIGSSPVTNIDIAPIMELKVSEVKLPYLTRNADGSKSYNAQTAGVAINGESQIITVSGKELDTFLPKDMLNSFTATNTTTDFGKYLRENDSFTKGILTQYGATTAAQMAIGGVYGGYVSISYQSNAGFPGTYSGTYGYKYYNGLSATSANGKALPITGTLTTDNSLPAWAVEQGLSIQQITLRGTLTHEFAIKYYRFSNINGGTYAYYQPPSWIQNNQSSFAFSDQYYDGYDPTYGYYTYQVASKDLTCTAYLISGIASGATVYQNADYSFAFPPANLASNLLAAQNWLPYEGTIQLSEQDAGSTRYRGTKVNVTGSLSSLSTIGALVQSESLDIMNGTTTISLGCAPRNDYRTFVSKIRKTSQDNIIYLNE
jgi:uncharacterized delta-60 repeat protein